MSEMFSDTQFNQPLSGWNVSNVQDMSSMFKESQFNQPINNWVVSGVADMTDMFYGTPFNQPLSGWDVSNVKNMSQMFSYSQFNQFIGNWDVSNVKFMYGMFLLSQFNQNIGNWNISGVTNFINFMLGKTPLTFSTTNLDAIYNGWSTKNPKPNLNITFGSANYTISGGQAGRDILTGSTGSGGYGWAITDGGGI
jgi:surface protein